MIFPAASEWRPFEGHLFIGDSEGRGSAREEEEEERVQVDGGEFQVEAPTQQGAEDQETAHKQLPQGSFCSILQGGSPRARAGIPMGRCPFECFRRIEVGHGSPSPRRVREWMAAGLRSWAGCASAGGSAAQGERTSCVLAQLGGGPVWLGQLQQAPRLELPNSQGAGGPGGPGGSSPGGDWPMQRE